MNANSASTATPVANGTEIQVESSDNTNSIGVAHDGIELVILELDRITMGMLADYATRKGIPETDALGHLIRAELAEQPSSISVCAM